MKNKLIWFGAGMVVSFLFKEQIADAVKQAGEQVKKTGEA
jgi:hypothetical protein